MHGYPNVKANHPNKERDYTQVTKERELHTLISIPALRLEEVVLRIAVG